jgi:hypothetical protein
MLGISLSNYAGSNGAFLNPSSIVGSKLYMDINLLTLDVFAENNYAYIHNEDFSIGNFLKKDPVLPSYGPDEMAFDHYDKSNLKNGYVQVLVRGPSAMLVRGKHAWAIHTGARYLTSFNRIPPDVANFGYYGLDYTEQHNINYHGRKMRTGVIGMGEVGFTYSYAFRRYSMSFWSAGITVKGLFSGGGGYFYGEDLDYIMVNDSTANVRNLWAEVGIAAPLDYDNNDFPDSGPLIKGAGFGVDFGITYQRKVLSYQKKRVQGLCSQAYIDYIYRIGFSLLDIGAVKFRNNAMVHAYEDVGRYWYNIDTLGFHSMNAFMRTLSDVFYNDPDASYRGDVFSVFLPMAVSVQGDYKFYKNYYVGGVFIYPLLVSKSMIQRPVQLAIAPRYETPSFEFSLPISLYDWKYPRLGAAIRFEFFTIGTDKLLTWFGVTDFTGMDIYASVKINFRKGNCGRGARFKGCQNGEFGSTRRTKPGSLK